MRRSVYFFALFLLTTAAAATDSRDAEIKQLFDQSRWRDVISVVEKTGVRSADLDYYYGSALAQVGSLPEARTAFLAGRKLQPNDKRFPIELAGLAFKQKDYPAAIRWLRMALRIDRNDDYANNFAATVYYLEGNTEAAIRYWNRTGKPTLQKVVFDPMPRLRADVLDRAFAFSPGSVLELGDLITSERRVEGLGIFPVYGFRLAARDDGKFDIGFNAQERNGFGNNKLQALVSIFSGAFYQTVYPAYYNLVRSAVNVTSLIRWDAQKRRGALNLSGPWRLNSKWRYTFGMDLRNENWAIRDSFSGPAPVLGSLNLRRAVVSGGVESFTSGRWGWSAGAEVSYRDYRSVEAGTAITPNLLLSGYQLKQLTSVNYELLRIPERRFVIEGRGTSQLARIWSAPSHSFAKLQSELDSRWLPQTRGDDYEMQSRVSLGKTFGEAPFDELFMLGLERDNDLWLRAHIGTYDGVKGSAPLGRSYFLSNWEMDKNLYDNGLLGLKLGPFVDTGKMMDTTTTFATSKWMWDTGAQTKISVLGVGMVFSYGKDLRTGNNAFYAQMEKSFTKAR
ncbi:MAG TPA: tetratricopeptide repeat protein [Terriglobales bacterium]|nr:tetratricopeptide repeat protein [Terriglobales bacterium]